MLRFKHNRAFHEETTPGNPALTSPHLTFAPRAAAATVGSNVKGRAQDLRIKEGLARPLHFFMMMFRCSPLQTLRSPSVGWRFRARLSHRKRLVNRRNPPVTSHTVTGGEGWVGEKGRCGGWDWRGGAKWCFDKVSELRR